MYSIRKSTDALFTFYPMAPVAVCLALGIVGGHLWVDGLEDWLVTGGVGGALALLLGFAVQRDLRLFALLLAFAALGAGVAMTGEGSLCCRLPDGRVACKGVVAGEPVMGDGYVRADVILTGGELRGRTVRVYLRGGSGAHRLGVGDGVAMEARLCKPVTLANSNFNYPLYLKCRGIVAVGSAFEGHWRKVEADWGVLTMVQRVRLKAMGLRHALVERYGELGLTGDALAVASAMTLGDKSALGKELRQTYADTGTSHILALSGMHLGIIYTLLLFLTFGRGHGVVRTVLLLTAVWVFVVLVGLSPSVVRAAVMLTVYSVVALSTRQPTSANTLALTAVLMLVASPLSLFDIGFQLSYVAVGAIVVFGVPIGRLVPSSFQQAHPVLRYVWQLAVMSTVAQVATMPLSIYYFGQTSLYFLLANFVVIPAASVILYASVAVFALAPFPVLCQAAASVMAIVSNSLNAVLTSIASLPGATLSGLHLSGLQLVLLQAVAIAILWAAAMAVRMKRAFL